MRFSLILLSIAVASLANAANLDAFLNAVTLDAKNFIAEVDHAETLGYTDYQCKVLYTFFTGKLTFYVDDVLRATLSINEAQPPLIPAHCASGASTLANTVSVTEKAFQRLLEPQFQCNKNLTQAQTNIYTSKLDSWISEYVDLHDYFVQERNCPLTNLRTTVASAEFTATYHALLLDIQLTQAALRHPTLDCAAYNLGL